MAISTSFARPKSAVTNTESISFTTKAYDDDANDRVIIDTYATVNAALRLIMRQVVQTVWSGVEWKPRVYYVTYLSNADDTYDDTDLASATTAPFTIPATLSDTKVPEIDMDAFFTAAGDARGA